MDGSDYGRVQLLQRHEGLRDAQIVCSHDRKRYFLLGACLGCCGVLELELSEGVGSRTEVGTSTLHDDCVYRGQLLDPMNCCNKVWFKTKLWAAYVLSINKRPFGSGANATQKQRHIEVFSVQCVQPSLS